MHQSPFLSLPCQLQPMVPSSCPGDVLIPPKPPEVVRLLPALCSRVTGIVLSFRTRISGPILVQPVPQRDAAALSPSPGLSTSSPLPPQPHFQLPTSSYVRLPCCWRGQRYRQRCLQQKGLESTASILRVFKFYFIFTPLFLFSSVAH